MTRITRYILVELLTVFIVTLTALTSLMIIVGIAGEAMRQGLGPVAILRLVPYLLPEALRFSVPGTILFAACSVYGRMSADNEIIAIKSLGIAPRKLVIPALVLAFILSVVTVWLNDVAVSWGRDGINRVVIQSVEEITYGMLRTQRSYSTRRFSINVREVVGKKLIRPTLVIYGDEDEMPVTLTAQEAELRSDLEKNVLIIILRDGLVDFHGKASLEFKDTFIHEIPLHHAAQKTSQQDNPSNYPLKEIPNEMTKQHHTIQQLQRSFATLAAFQMVSGDFGRLHGGQWPGRQQQLAVALERLSRLETESWRRWANGFGCLCFVMVGAPLAIWRRSGDVWTNFFFCFMPILVLYYPLMAIGLDRAKAGAWPPYSVWLGNVILIVIGLWMIHKARRY